MTNNPFDPLQHAVRARVNAGLLAAFVCLRADETDQVAPPLLFDPAPTQQGVYVVTLTASELTVAFDPDGEAQRPLLLAADATLDTQLREISGSRRKGEPGDVRVLEDQGQFGVVLASGVWLPAKPHDGHFPPWRHVLSAPARASECVLDAARLARYARVAQLLARCNLSPLARQPIRIARSRPAGLVEASFAMKSAHRFSVLSMPVPYADTSLDLAQWMSVADGAGASCRAA